MWFLTNPAGVRTYLKPNESLSFGRKNSNILLENDESLSRLHASITVTVNQSSNHKDPTSKCTLQDLNSKYGTYVSRNAGEFLKISTQVLQPGDKIRFGLQEHIFVLHHMPIVSATSSVTPEDREKLESLFNQIDGAISEEWTSSCTHLTVTQALLTEKVVWALIFAVPVVTLEYWVQVRKAMEKGGKIPSVNDYVPPIGEGLINKDKVSLCPNKARSNLFKDMIFIYFSSKQFRVYGKMVHLAGGKSIVFGKRPLTLKDFCASNVVAVQFPDAEASQASQELLPEYEDIYEQMRSKNLRIVPETEIPLAILHCSIKTYCNPRHKFKLRLEKRTPDLGEVIVGDTQDVEQGSRRRPTIISDVTLKSSATLKNKRNANVIIPETCDFVSDGSPTANASTETSLSESSKESSIGQKSCYRTPEREKKVSNTKTIESPKPKEPEISTKPLLNEKPIVPDAEDAKSKWHGIIIPETLEILNATNKLSSNSLMLSKEVSIVLSPKLLQQKSRVPEKHPEQSLMSLEKSPTLGKRNEPMASRFRRNPLCSQADTKVINPLAVLQRFPEEPVENPRTTSAKLPMSNNEHRRDQMPETPTKPTSKKRSRVSDEADEPPVKKNLWFDKSKEQETTGFSSINTTSKSNPKSPVCIRMNPLNKVFKKAKVRIPAQRLCFTKRQH